MNVITNSVAAIKKRPNLYLRNGIFSCEDLVGQLVTQGYLLGAKSVLTFQYSGQWYVSSDSNWLVENNRLDEPDAPFKKIIAEPRMGQNSFYNEILLAAFASSIYVLIDMCPIYTKGNCEFTYLETLKSKLVGYPLTICFSD